MKFLILFIIYWFSAQSACLEKLRELLSQKFTKIPKILDIPFRTELYRKTKSLIEAYPNKFTKKIKENGTSPAKRGHYQISKTL